MNTLRVFVDNRNWVTRTSIEDVPQPLDLAAGEVTPAMQGDGPIQWPTRFPVDTVVGDVWVPESKTFRSFTAEEISERAAEQSAAESARQAAKKLELKQAENNFFLLVNLIGFTGKPGFNELQSAIEAMMSTDPMTATALSLKLLATDAACKREGGNLWWDDAAWHPEIVQ